MTTMMDGTLQQEPIGKSGLPMSKLRFLASGGQSEPVAHEQSVQQPVQQAPAADLSINVDAGEGDSPGFLSTLVDMGKGVIGGVGDAINETSDFAHGVVNWADNKIGTDVIDEENKWRLPTMAENVTGFGRVTRGISQFVAGFVGAGKILKATNVLQGATKAAGVARGMTAGAITDAVAFDPHQDRLSNLIEEFPDLANPVTRYLASKDSDSEAEGRFKNALEGLALGAMTESLFIGIRAMKQLKSAKSGAEAARIQEEAADAIQAAGGVKQTEEEMTDAIVLSVQNRSGRQASVHDEFIQAMEAPRDVSGAVGDGYKTADELHRIISKANNSDEVLEMAEESVNFKRWIFENRYQENGLRGIADALYEKTVKAKGPEGHHTIYNDTVDWLSKAGLDTSKLIQMTKENADQLPKIAREMYAARMALGGLAKEAARVSTLIDSGRHELRDLITFHALHRDLQDLHVAVADVRTGFGRGLSSQKMKVDIGNLPEGKVDLNGPTGGKPTVDAPDVPPVKEPVINPDDIKNMTDEEILDYMAKHGLDPDKIKQTARIVRMADGDPFAVNRIMNKAFNGSKWGLWNEYWVNSLLSGYKTQGINLIGNSVKALMMPAERMIGGALHGDMNMVREGFHTFAGISKFFGDAIMCAKKAFKADTNIIDAGHSVFDGPTHQITYQNIKRLMLSKGNDAARLMDLDAGTLNPMQEIVARSMGYLGTVLRLPSRFLMTGDEFFKQLNFRADLYARLNTKALEKFGRKADPDVVSRWVAQEMDTYFEQGGRAVDFNAILAKEGLPEDVAAAAKAKSIMSTNSLRYAQESTWTQSLNYGYGQSLQRFASAHPSFRMVMPFIRTPTNIFRDFVAHTPGVANLTRRYKEAMAQGGEAAAMAHGQLATGTMLWATGAMLASSGAITGAPPKDQKEYQQLLATGWQPWSLKIGDKYYAYNRLDPIGMFLGMSADFTRISQEAGEQEAGEVAASMIIALANNLTSKSYLTGLSNAVGTLMDPDRNAESYLKGLVASALPFSGLRRNVRQDMTDENMREVQGIIEYVQNTMPGMSDDLPAKRNWVNGEPVKYAWTGTDKRDVVFDEMTNLGKSILGAPPKKIKGGHELTSAQYSRLCELHGTLKVQGKTLHERLGELFASEKYDIDRKRVADPILGEEGPRATIVNKVIQAYRKAAINQLLRENPELIQAVENSRRVARASKKGALTQANQDQFAQLLNF